MTAEEIIVKHEEILANRQRAYMLAFKAFGAELVLADLATFCRANESCVVPGDRDMTFVAEGRREVYLRICHHLDLPIEKLLQRYPLRPAKGAISHDRPDADPHSDT